MMWVAGFSAVNESTWEHMKLAFFPMLLFSFAANLFLKKDYPYSPMVTGIHMLTSTDYICYDVDYSEELVKLIINEIKQYFSL